MFKIRSRLVTFRLSPEEYQSLCNVCEVNQSRSISEFARTAVLHRMTKQNGASGMLIEDLKILTEELSELDGSLESLRDQISRVLKLKRSEESVVKP